VFSFELESGSDLFLGEVRVEVRDLPVVPLPKILINSMYVSGKDLPSRCIISKFSQGASSKGHVAVSHCLVDKNRIGIHAP
jgi:hypothetical protein